MSLWRVRRKMSNMSLKELIKTGNLIKENKRFVVLGIGTKSKVDQVGQQGVPTSWLSPYYQREDYSGRRPVLRLLLWKTRWEMLALKRLIRTGHLIIESRFFIFGIKKKSKVDQVGQQGVPTSWLSPYCQREDYSSRRPVLRLLLWNIRWEMLALKRPIRTGHLIIESRFFIFGIRKKSKVDQVGQQGVPTSWLSSYYQREDYSSRSPVLRLLLWRVRWAMLAI